MNTPATTVRRGLFGMFAGGLLAFGSAAIIAPVAGAQPAPAPGVDCSASGVAGTVSSATASEGAYLAANPQTNEALTSISTQPQPAAQDAYRAFFAQNPQVQDELTTIHEPVSVLQNECGLQMTPTPVAQAVWSSTEAAPMPEVMQPMTPEPAEMSEVPEPEPAN